MLCVKLLQESTSFSSYENNDIGESRFIHTCLMGTITFEVHHITLTSPRNTLATIYKSILILLAFHILCIFFLLSIKRHIMHKDMGERKEIPIYVSQTSFFFFAV